MPAEENKTKYSRVLKIALLATGFSGIVAEYILSTLASYFIGNAILQFTLIMSFMLFSMGLGSRVSKYFTQHIVFYFVMAELVLSLLVSFSALIAYMVYGTTQVAWLVIYVLAIIIGLLIGLEIPFATRINESYEELRVNISQILEKDYFGSLLGGLFFAFIGLPYLGLTYTPFVLGLINLGVSFWLYKTLVNKVHVKHRRIANLAYLVVGTLITMGVFAAQPLILYGEQVKYKDKIVFSQQTQYQKIVLTQWNNWHSLYINGNQQLSSFDEFLYHEPLVHIPMGLNKNTKNVLVLGGGDGCTVREVLKHKQVKNITVVDLDPVMTDLGKQHEVLIKLNENSLNNPKVRIVNEDAFTFLEKQKARYDLIITDLPDPNSVDLNKLYTKSFYKLCLSRLHSNGFFITQAGSPYYATEAFYTIAKTMRAAGFHTLPMHNQVLTLGEWGWVLGHRNKIEKEDIHTLAIQDKELKWLNQDALKGLTAFGKPLVDTSNLKVNTIFDPSLYIYYKKGNWNIY